MNVTGLVVDQYAIDEVNFTGGGGGGGFLSCKRPTSSMTCKRNGTRLLHTTRFYVFWRYKEINKSNVPPSSLQSNLEDT